MQIELEKAELGCKHIILALIFCEGSELTMVGKAGKLAHLSIELELISVKIAILGFIASHGTLNKALGIVINAQLHLIN